MHLFNDLKDLGAKNGARVAILTRNPLQIKKRNTLKRNINIKKSVPNKLLIYSYFI